MERVMSSAGPRVTAVIVTYKSRKVVGLGLAALREGVEQGELRVMVVDNQSADGTAEHVRAQFPFVEVIDSGGNLGFGRGCNRGFSEVDTEFTVFVNPDAVMPLSAIRTLVGFFDRHPRAGICVPGIPGQPAGLMTTPQAILREAVGLASFPHAIETTSRDTPFRTDWAGGAIFMIRSKLFRALGGFDPRFFLYFEETDLCRRATKRNAEIWVVPTAQAEHEAHASALLSGKKLVGGNIAEYFFQSRFYYLSKHWGYPVAVLTELLELPPLTLRACARMLRSRAEGRGPSALAQRLEGTLFQIPPHPR
jgi:N-acetylglucosaminyl-diphospho-decaprenol L-rhamnosyltransferase